jgi:S1-C subfamily serine protease
VAQRVLLNARSFWSGIDFVVLQDTLAQVFNLPQSAGLLVQQVATGSPGALLGVRAGTIRVQVGAQQVLGGGDVVLGVGGIDILPNGTSLEQIQNYLSGLRAGDSVRINVLRGGKVVRLAGAVRGR